MRENLEKRMKLSKRFSLMISLGLWSNKIAQPDGQVLERIQRLNNDIEELIKELYIPENEIERRIKKIKQTIYQESTGTTNRQIDKKSEKGEKGLHLGKSVSNWLNDYDEDKSKLERFDLPSLPDLKTIAEVLETDENRLIWLVFHQSISQTVHYRDFTIPKGDEVRKISKPCKAINAIQRKIKIEILDRLKFADYVHGFVKGRNILDNVKSHVNANSLVTIDIRDFFGNITFKMVRGAFKRLGYSGMTSTILALATTKQDQQEVKIGDLSFWKLSEHRYLPQGSATSPGVSNLVASRFDEQLFTRSAKLNFRYSRYADDLTFSTEADNPDHRAILYLARKTLELHNFEVNPNKVKILFPHHKQQITGININAGKPTIPRSWRRKLRAAVHQFRFIKDPDLKEEEYQRIMGSIQHLKLTHRKKAKQYEIEINRYYQLS